MQVINSINDEKNHVFVVERMEGKSLATFMQDFTVSEDLVHRMMVPLFDAIVYCHNYGVSHQNIKPKNILFIEKDES